MLGAEGESQEKAKHISKLSPDLGIEGNRRSLSRRKKEEEERTF